MPYLEKFNSDDIHARSVIAGLLSYMNQEVFILNTWSNEDGGQEIVEVPFYYSMTGDERYLQDFFAHTWNGCLKPGLEGNFDSYPRGAVKLDSMAINTGSMTQRWIRGTFNRVIKNLDDDGNVVSENLEAFNAYFNSIPETMTFSVEVMTDTMTDAFKIQQTIIEVFYRSAVFYTTFKGVLVPCQVGFPEQYAIEKTFEMSYPSDGKIKMTFSLEVETYMPVMDEPTFASNDHIANVNKMNDWLENKPTDSYETYSDEGMYAKHVEGNDNVYYVGKSRRDLVKVRLGHNDISSDGCPTKNSHYVDDNMSYEKSSIMKNSNRIEKFVFGSFGDSIEPESKFEFNAEKNGSDIECTWKYPGYIDKIDIYMARCDSSGNYTYVKRLSKYNNASKRKTSVKVTDDMFASTFAVQVAINSSNAKGSGAEAFAVIDESGEVIDVIVTENGSKYDETTVAEIEYDGTVYSDAELIPIIEDGKLRECKVRSKGNYDVEGKEFTDSSKIVLFAVTTTGRVKSNDVEISA